MPIGAIFTSDSINKALRDYNKNYYGQSTWNTLYNKIANSEQSALNTLAMDYDIQRRGLSTSYADTIADAYAAYQSNMQQIGTSNFGAGYRDLLLQENQNALQKAYEQYKTNYQQSLSELSSGYEKNVANITSTAAAATNEIDTLLNKQSSNVKSYLNYANNYIYYLYNNNPALFEGLAWSRYLNEDGTVKSYDEIFSTDAGTLTYDDTSDQYYLTDKGREIYQQIFNERGFGKYLQNTDAKLYDWLYSTGYDNSRNVDMIYRDVLGFTDDSYMNYKYKDEFIDKQGKKITADDFTGGIIFDDDNLLVKDYIDEDVIKSSRWQLSDAGTDAKSFFADDNKSNVLSGQTGKLDGKKGSIFDELKEKFENGGLKEGMVFDINYGNGENYYVYMDGKVYELNNNITVTFDFDGQSYTKKPDADVYVNDSTDIFGNFLGKSGGKQDTYVDRIITDAKAGNIQKGQIVSPNYGWSSGDRDLYVYLGNGQFEHIDNINPDIRLTDKYKSLLYVPVGYKADGWTIELE